MYSYCERKDATSKTPWHIRPLTSLGQKFGGGIDTESFCGYVTPQHGGWDVHAKITEKNLKHCCEKCRAVYKSFTAKANQ